MVVLVAVGSIVTEGSIVILGYIFCMVLYTRESFVFLKLTGSFVVFFTSAGSVTTVVACVVLLDVLVVVILGAVLTGLVDRSL